MWVATHHQERTSEKSEGKAREQGTKAKNCIPTWSIDGLIEGEEQNGKKRNREQAPKPSYHGLFGCILPPAGIIVSFFLNTPTHRGNICLSREREKKKK